MIGILSIEKHIKQILDNVNDTVLYSHDQECDMELLMEIMQKTTLVNIKTLIIDLSICTDDDALFKAIQMYRMKKSGRVVVIAPGRSKGDFLLGQLFSIGVYDFIIPSEENGDYFFGYYLNNQLQSESHMANAIDYQISSQASEHHGNKTEAVKKKLNVYRIDPKERLERAEQKKKAREEKQKDLLQLEKIIYRDRIVGNVIIAVAGVERRTGTTTTAIEIAKYIHNKGLSVLYVDFLNHVELSVVPVLKNMELKFDIFHAKDINELIEIQSKSYQYIIIDLGELFDYAHAEKTMQYIEFTRADLHIMTSGSSDWDYERQIQSIEKMKQWNFEKKIHCVVNTLDEKEFKTINELLSNKEKKLLNIHYWYSPIMNKSRDMLGDLLSDVVSQKNKKKSFFFS